MVYLPFKDIDIPDIDLVTLVFDSSSSRAREETPLHVDATFPSNLITKSQTRSLIKRLVAIFQSTFSVGASGPGADIVTCIATNQILLPALFFSVIGAGGIYAAASSSLTVFELARQIRSSGSTLLVASEETRDVALAAAKECGIPAERVLVLSSKPGAWSLADTVHPSRNLLDRHEERDWLRITNKKLLDEVAIALMFSSGTTGPPKGVIMTHHNLVSQTLVWQATLLDSLNSSNSRYRTFEYRTLGHLPAAHVAGSQGYFINPTVSGGTCFWMPKFELQQFIRYNKEYRITHMISVPSILLQCVNDSGVSDHFHSLVHLQIGAAPLGPDLQRRGQALLAQGAYLNQSWGLTETCAASTMTPWYQSDLTGGIGSLLPNCRLKIVGEDGEEVAEGKEGEILVKGPIVTRGYWRNEVATKEAFAKNGWLKTGDVGLRRDGIFYIVDRKKELIKYKGLQIAPAELEAHLLSHPSILDAAVIGIPDPKIQGNEIPRAYIVIKEEISEQEVQAFVKKDLAAHKQLRGGVRFVEEIPKSASGKILRRELREWAKEEEKAKRVQGGEVRARL